MSVYGHDLIVVNLSFYFYFLCRQLDDEPLRVSKVDDLERIRISRHKLERYPL